MTTNTTAVDRKQSSETRSYHGWHRIGQIIGQILIIWPLKIAAVILGLFVAFYILSAIFAGVPVVLTAIILFLGFWMVADAIRSQR